MATSRGLALIELGISISLDELAIGFSIGLSRLPAVAVIVAIAAQLAWHSGRRSPNAGASAPNDSPASP